MASRSTSDLRPSLTRLNAIALVAGTIIGASIFVQPSEIAQHLSKPSEIMLVWLACGVLTLFGALVCAELASAFPQTGGLYIFLRETFSAFAGFLWGWAMFWVMHTGIIAIIAIVFARYTAYFVPVGDTGVRAIAVIVILGLSALNYVGIRAGSQVQTVLTGAKILAIGAIVVVGFALIASGSISPFDGAQGAPSMSRGAAVVGADPARGITTDTRVTDFLLAMVAGLFAYGGWHMVTYTAGETVMPARVIPVALIVGVAIVTACYVALNLLYLTVLPLDLVRSSTRVAAEAADAAVGRGGAAIMAGLVMVSTFGALTGIVLAGPRVYYSMAKDGLTFRWLGYVHPTYGTPSRAIAAQAVWASLLAATGVYRQLFIRVIYTEWLFFALMAAGVVALRRRPGYRPEYRMWGYPAVVLIFIAAALVIVVNQIVRDPIDALIGLGIVAIGAPAYYLWAAHAHH